MLTAFLLVVVSQGLGGGGSVLLDRTGSGTLNALNATCSVSMAAETGVGMQLAAGTLVGVITPEVSFDNGTTWVGTFFDDPLTGSKQSSITVVGPALVLTQTIIGAGGISNARVRVTQYTSGTAACTMRSSMAVDPTLLAGGGISAVTGNMTRPPTGLQVGGYDVISGLYSAPEVKPPSATPQGSETALVVNSAEAVRIRRILEELLEVEKQNQLLLRAIKDPGAPSP